MGLTPCRECRREVSTDAPNCPQCGAPAPAKAVWDGYGWAYKSKIKIGGLPLLHISFKYNNMRPVPAVGVVAIGQFAAGVVTVAQFGLGLFGVGQFMLAALAVGQFAAAYAAWAQISLAAVDLGKLVFS